MKSNDLYKKIFEWMNVNIGAVSKMSISEIAAANFTTSSTITKALQAYGYKGFKEFKNIVLLSKAETNKSSTISNQIEKLIVEIINNNEFINSFRVLSHLIEDATEVLISGRGFSMMSALLLQRIITNKFDKNVRIIEDIFLVKKTTENPLLIGISFDRTSEMVNRMGEEAFKKHIPSILITKQISAFSKVKASNFKKVMTIPNHKGYLDHHDEPIITKTALEIAATIYLKRSNDANSN